MGRVFTDSAAVRKAAPLLIGLQGPSGSGKTRSALRLATGIQRVSGGDIYYVDTESNRALHYADKYKFRHVPFGAPFGSLDYLEVLNYIAAKTPGVTIIDSMSHEHEGDGGYLSLHEAEVRRLMEAWKVSDMKAQIPAWGKPAAARQRLINTILQMPGNFIFCFRSKEKLKIETGKDPVQLGWMPIAGDAFLFEMTVSCLLLPGAKGVPTWKTDYPGEKMMIKDPDQFAWLYGEKRPLDEDTGEKLARWAAGDAPAASPRANESTQDRRTVDLGVLKDALEAGGLTTPAGRLNWIRLKLKKPVEVKDLTQEQIDTLNAIAKEGV